MKIFLKTEDEIKLMREANQLVGLTLAELGKNIKPGVSTLQLDVIAEKFIYDHGAIPVLKNFPSPFGGLFPTSICTSVNHVIAYGIPDALTILKEGDVVSIHCGILLNGYVGESSYTFCVGKVDEKVEDLLKVTQKALYLGIEQAVSGHHIGDIGYAIQHYCEGLGYGVVRELTGHGIGREMFEAPQIPNYGTRGNGLMLKSGMCITIEPMITTCDNRVWMLPDKVGIYARDKRPTAHFGHTVVIRKGEAEILSSFEEIEKIVVN